MKPLQAILTALWLTGMAGQAAVSYGNFTSTMSPTAILDGNPNGFSTTIEVGGLWNSLTDVNVTVNMSGGYNGDLYAYLTGPQGTMSVLLNRVGNSSGNRFGSGDSGFNVKFNDQTAVTTDFHLYGTISRSITSGTEWRPDGRNIDPQLVLDTDTRTATLGAHNLSDPNGTWTLFIGDMANGGVSTLNGWSLEVTAVPEPVNVALGIFAGLGLVVGVCRSCFGKRTNQI